MTLQYKQRARDDIRERRRGREQEARRDRREAVDVGAVPRTPRNDLLPTCPKGMRALDQLKPADRKVRKLTEAQVARVIASIQAYGFIAPILIADDGRIIDGHTRAEAAKRLGLNEIPCLVVDHLSPIELKALKIAINRTAETGVWDLPALELELGELVVDGFEIELTGFSTPEIDAVLPARAESVPPPPRAVAASQPGDLWLMGPHKLLCGSALERSSFAALMGDDLARLVLTDEPYNVPIAGHVTSGDHREFAMAAGEMTLDQFGNFNLTWMTLCNGCLTPGGMLGTFIDWRSVDLVIRTGKLLDLELLNLIVWEKTNAGMGSLWRSQHELLPMFKKGGAPHINNIELGKHGRNRSNVWTYPGANSLGSSAQEMLADHPTPKPVPMLQDALLDVTERGDIVLDPFLGSGSMLIAAEATGRRCRGIELDPLYVDLAVRRWETQTGETAFLQDGGISFSEIATARSNAADAAEVR